MTSLQSSLSAVSSIRLNFTSSSSSSSSTPTSRFTITSGLESHCRLRHRFRCTAMVQQAVQGAPATYAKEMERLSAKESLLLAMESKIVLSSKLSMEGPLRMKEEFVEGIFESPRVIEETLPEQLKGAFNQAVTTLQQLPVSIRDAVAGGLRIPLSGTFQRLFMISYLDEEILIIRDSTGVPEVLTRLDAPLTPLPEPLSEYES